MNRLVSIIIPTYDRPNTLKRAINSALDQTHSDLEVIVVDDNNPDTVAREKTKSSISDFADKRLIYIKHQENRNGAAARNTGIQNASGSYIAFLDDDDEFEPNKIEEQLRYLKSNKQFNIVYCKAKNFKNESLYFKTEYNKEGNIQFLIIYQDRVLGGE
jgi:glycosyltransferase involved in cell wall biosynthesis